MTNIIDVIVTDKKRVFVVVDKMPELVYERHPDRILVGHDDGFWSALKHGRPSKNNQAFGGHKFDIPMKDGTIIHASGEWWDSGYEAITERIGSVGVGTLDGLATCYVFVGYHISMAKLEAWLEDNEPSDDYWKYNPNPPLWHTTSKEANR